MYKKRLIENKVLMAARNFKVVLVVGARQVGKSTLLRKLFPHLPMITFNPFQDVQNARREPALFLERFEGPVILDEIQYAPEVLAFIKLQVDKSHEKGQFFLTGSQNLSMLKSVAESMAGRVAIIELGPMILHELEEVQSRHWLAQYLEEPRALLRLQNGTIEQTSLVNAVWRGGFPGLINVEQAAIPAYFDSYLKTYIDRDIRTMAGIDELVKFENFVAILAALTAQEINYEHLGREIGIAGKTAQRWLNLLFGTYLWKDIRAFSGNTIKRVSQKPKGYLIDTGLVCQLLHLRTPEQWPSHPSVGGLFETYVSTTIFSILNALPFGVAVYHWRSGTQAEVDLVIQSGNCLYPIEIKIQGSVGHYEARGIKAFKEMYKNSPLTVMPGLIVYAGKDCYSVTEDVIAVPWNLLLKQ